jgi:hypothetical protein
MVITHFRFRPSRLFSQARHRVAPVPQILRVLGDSYLVSSSQPSLGRASASYQDWLDRSH